MKAPSLAARTFVFASLPVCTVLLSSFLVINWRIRNQIKQEITQSLRSHQVSLDRLRLENAERVRRTLGILAENAGLKAGISLLRELSLRDAVLDARSRREIGQTLEAQLQDLSGMLDYDFFALIDWNDRPVVAILRKGANLQSIPAPEPLPEDHSLIKLNGGLYALDSVPINLNSENLGRISVGKLLQLNTTSAGEHAVLLQGASLLLTTLPQEWASSVGASVARACARSETCEVEIDREVYLAHAAETATLGSPFRLFHLRSVDAATARLTNALRGIMLTAAIASLIVAFLLSGIGARSVAGPLRLLSETLLASEREGTLPTALSLSSRIPEVVVLTESLQRAARSALDSQQKLEHAYLQFLESMTEALDARDAYTAGHSRRVSEYSVGIARVLGLDAASTETIRIGSLLHDIGKIGIPDGILNKQGRLTDEEFAVIKLHPQIGTRILERVGRYEEYLPIVELHHENHDGTGYPHRMSGSDIPLAARIVHVADAYDAMSSNRSYRTRLPEERIRQILQECAGTQFDPAVVKAFLRLEVSTFVEVITEELEKLDYAIQTWEVPALAVPGVEPVR